MGMNPRYTRWTRENWYGHAPTLGDMERRNWIITALCARCGLEMAVDGAGLIRRFGRGFSLWGRSARCRRLHCDGRMHFLGRGPHTTGAVDLTLPLDRLTAP